MSLLLYVRVEEHHGELLPGWFSAFILCSCFEAAVILGHLSGLLQGCLTRLLAKDKIFSCAAEKCTFFFFFFFKVRANKCKADGECPSHLAEAIPPSAEMHSGSQLVQESRCPLTLSGLGGQEGQTSYLLCG